MTQLFDMTRLYPLNHHCLTFMRIEFLYLPAVRMQYASEFGHLIRILTIFAKMEYVLDELNGIFLFLFFLFSRFIHAHYSLDPKLSTNPIPTLNEAEQKMDVCWSIPTLLS